MALRRWLVSQGRVEEALVIMKRLEKSNGTTVPAGVYQQFEVSLRSVVVDAQVKPHNPPCFLPPRTAASSSRSRRTPIRRTPSLTCFGARG